MKFINNDVDFENLLKDIVGKDLAVDFECEYNRHKYGEFLCLVQIFDGKNCYVIDALM
ncbi:hypothetical protein [Campylobacter gastrosuis]|uniref:3'-5' exonuclease domain-containing protein n=1 Tax=Campylobacter gastrosuis TaxID=2974576 RepID=A0ABT7HS64_9BACT|nr:hypothetical protein [Campylobacter gastrosuis]MDL0089752.1 hypothetical protein [Campylobacter gastrosuis]